MMRGRFSGRHDERGLLEESGSGGLGYSRCSGNQIAEDFDMK